MIKRIFFLTILIAAIAFAGTAFAQSDPPPAYGSYGGGWGMNPNNWQTASGTFSAWGLYDPTHVPLGGAAWVVGWNPTTWINYAPIKLELWIEMYCMQTYRYTSYKWHRLGNQAEQITFIVEGIMQSNNGQWVSLMKDTEDLTSLYFRHDILNRTGATYGSDIPLSWEGRWGDGLVYGNSTVMPWAPITPDGEGDLNLGPIPACDHWFQFKGTFYLEYHVPDGYYSLTMAGCPAPEM